MSSSPGCTPEEVIETLVKLAYYTDIAHHIPGRIRLKISPAGVAHLKDVDPDRLAASVPGINGFQVKVLSKSVVIEYDKTRLSYQLWHDLAKLKQHPDYRAQMGKLLREVLSQ